VTDDYTHSTIEMRREAVERLCQGPLYRDPQNQKIRIAYCASVRTVTQTLHLNESNARCRAVGNWRKKLGVLASSMSSLDLCNLRNLWMFPCCTLQKELLYL
jgi:hypothetical protein